MKLRVRAQALLLDEFTIGDLVRSTRLNANSVRTEVQRMKQERLLNATTITKSPKQRGRRSTVHKITDDIDARLRLAESVQAYYGTPKSRERPAHPAYKGAKDKLDRALTLMPTMRDGLLAEAWSDLVIAAQGEGGLDAPESVRAYLGVERARLYYLKGQYDIALRLFLSLRAHFTAIDNHDMVSSIDTYQMAISASSVSPVAVRLLDFLYEDQPKPLIDASTTRPDPKHVLHVLDAAADTAHHSLSLANPLVQILRDALRQATAESDTTEPSLYRKLGSKPTYNTGRSFVIHTDKSKQYDVTIHPETLDATDAWELLMDDIEIPQIRSGIYAAESMRPAQLKANPKHLNRKKSAVISRYARN